MEWYNIHFSANDISDQQRTVVNSLLPKINLHPTASGLAIFSRQNSADGSLDLYLSPELSIANLKFIKNSGGCACPRPDATDLTLVCGNADAWNYLRLRAKKSADKKETCA